MKSYLLPMLLSLFFSVSIKADNLVVIANPNSGIKQLSHNELVNLYLNRSRKLPSGITALPIDWSNDSDEKKIFYQQLVNKSLSEIQAFWAKLLFTGHASPPKQAENIAEILEMVSHNQGAIAYLQRNQINKKVIIVYEFDTADLP